jgi:hypothetical protein
VFFFFVCINCQKLSNCLLEKAISIFCCNCRQIPKQGNVAEIVLTVLHRNFIGVDEFLGIVNIPLAEFDVYERPRNRLVTHFSTEVAFVY